MYRHRFGILFLRRSKSLFTLFMLAILALSVNCASFNAKWKWVRNALAPVQSSFPIPEQSLAENLQFTSHPFLDARFQRQLDQVSNSYLTAGNELRLLADHSSTDAKLELIETAQSSIFIATHMIVCDEAGEQFLSALARAAKRGVDVRLMVDGGIWGAFGGFCPEDFRSDGVKVTRSAYSLLSSEHDMKLHDKIFVVDGEVGITGGQNIGNWWSESTGEDANFRDTDVWVKGPVVNQLALRFVQMWKTTHPLDHGLETYENRLNERAKRFLNAGLLGIQNYSKWLQEKEPKGLCRFVGQDPQIGTHYVFKVYTALTRASQNRIVFHVPSLNGLGSFEQEELLTALVDAAHKDSVQVDVITNGPGLMDSRMVNKTFGWIYGIYTLGRVYESVKDTPLNVYVYKYWIHSKVFDFDGLAVAIGSFNFDESGVDWMENTLICMDKGLSLKTGELLARDFSNSRLLPKTGNVKKSAT